MSKRSLKSLSHEELKQVVGNGGDGGDLPRGGWKPADVDGPKSGWLTPPPPMPRGGY